MIGHIDVLPRLFDQIVIPQYVASIELRNPKTPRDVHAWAAALPPWTEVRAPESPQNLGVHRGESEAIALSLELKAFAVLLDDADARRIAKSKGLATAGTIGILEAAADRGFLTLAEAFERLERTNFRIKPQLLKEALDRHAARR